MYENGDGLAADVDRLDDRLDVMSGELSAIALRLDQPGARGPTRPAGHGLTGRRWRRNDPVAGGERWPRSRRIGAVSRGDHRDDGLAEIQRGRPAAPAR